jgi:hypothetical protein
MNYEKAPTQRLSTAKARRVQNKDEGEDDAFF